MSGQWRPIQPTDSTFKGKYSSTGALVPYVDRNKEMSNQEQLIQQKKREIEQRLAEKKRQDQLAREMSDPKTKALAMYV